MPAAAGIFSLATWEKVAPLSLARGRQGCLTAPPTRKTDIRESVASLLATRPRQSYIRTYI